MRRLKLYDPKPEHDEPDGLDPADIKFLRTCAILMGIAVLMVLFVEIPGLVRAYAGLRASQARLARLVELHGGRPGDRGFRSIGRYEPEAERGMLPGRRARAQQITVPRNTDN